MSMEIYEYENGLTVEIDYDQCSSNLLEDNGTLDFAGITACERNVIVSDPNNFIRIYEEAYEQAEEIKYEFDFFMEDRAGTHWWETAEEKDLEWFADRVGDLLDAIDRRDRFAAYQITEYNEYGYPEYLIVINKEEYAKSGWTLSTEEFAKSAVDTYSAWANGSVFDLTFNYPSGQVEYCGGIYTKDHGYPDREECKMYADDCEPDGAYDVTDDATPVTVTVERVRQVLVADGMTKQHAESIIKSLTEEEK